MKLSLASLLALGLIALVQADTTSPKILIPTIILVTGLPYSTSSPPIPILNANSTGAPAKGKITWPKVDQLPSLTDLVNGGGGGGGGANGPINQFFPDSNFACDVTPNQCSLTKILIGIIIKIRIFLQSWMVRVNCPPVMPVITDLTAILVELIGKLNVVLPSETVIENVSSIWVRGWLCIRQLIKVIVIIIAQGWSPPSILPPPPPPPPPPCNYHGCIPFPPSPPPAVVIPPNDSFIVAFCAIFKLIERTWYSYCTGCSSVVTPYSVKAMEPVADPRASLIEFNRNLSSDLVSVHRLAPETMAITSDRFASQLKIASNWELLLTVINNLQPILSFVSNSFPGVTSTVSSLQSVINQLSGQLYNGLPMHEYMPAAAQEISPLWNKATGKVEQLITDISGQAGNQSVGDGGSADLVLGLLRSFLASMKQIFSPLSKATGVESREALAAMLDDIDKMKQVI